MKKIRIYSLFCFLAIILLAGCYGIPMGHNYTGMTKAEVAEHLEKYAFRDRWTGNRFAIEISVIGVAAPYWFNHDGEIIKNLPHQLEYCKKLSMLVIMTFPLSPGSFDSNYSDTLLRAISDRTSGSKAKNFAL